MSFANHNILDIALSIIPPTIVQIRKNLGTKVNKYGQVEAVYGDWIEVYGIVQPGSEQNEHTEGVDFSKKRVRIWLRGVALDGTHIQWAPDQIRYVGKIFNVVDVSDWFPYDNYRECECVEVLNLDESQRGRSHSNGNEAKQDSKNQMSPNEPKSYECKKEKNEGEPSIFCPDASIKEECVTPKNNSLVGKALIRF